MDAKVDVKQVLSSDDLAFSMSRGPANARLTLFNHVFAEKLSLAMEEFDRLSVSQFDADHAEKDIHEARAFESALLHEQLSDLDARARRTDANTLNAHLHQLDALARDQTEYLSRRAALLLQKESSASIDLGTKKAVTDGRFVVQLHRERIHRARHVQENTAADRLSAATAATAARSQAADMAAVGLDGAVPPGAIPPPRLQESQSPSVGAYGGPPPRGGRGAGTGSSGAPFGGSAAQRGQPSREGSVRSRGSERSRGGDTRGSRNAVSGTASRRGVVVVRVQVELGEGVPATIDVRDTDDPRQLANSFAISHRLGDAAEAALRSEITARQQEGVALYRASMSGRAVQM